MGKTNKSIRSIWKTIRVIWIVTGLSLLLWMAYSYQSRGFPKSVLQSDPLVTVSENSENISFNPIENRRITGFILYPGGMVDPKAYAPMARRLAENGFAVYIVKLPLGSAPLSGQEADVMDYTRQLMDTNQSIQRWVLGGHSRGAAIASRFASYNNDLFSGLILIGTSHPKDNKFDLSNSGLRVMKIYATHDGLASVSEIEETSKFLPNDTIWVKIDGGNHSQFGYFGTLLGDGRAEISREEQQKMTISAILSMLNDVDK
ncbi:MAG: alpha/beta hydrolase [Chloroflexota bacterium]